MSDHTIHLAPLVLSVTGSPISDGAVAVADGLIVGVGLRQNLLKESLQAEIVEWKGVLIPGLVNAHTHLQFTSFTAVGAKPHANYVAWSERFVDEYEGRKHEDWGNTATRGAEMALATGTTAFADVVTDVEALNTLVDLGVAGVSYLELIGVDEMAWKTSVEQKVMSILRDARRADAARIGISPHAPYSVDEPVLQEVAALARREGMRLHLHLAESDTEDSYYRTGSGALAERVTARVGRRWSILARDGVGVGAAEFADSCGLLGTDSHVAHGVYLGPEGRSILRERGTFVALCARSNLTVGIDPPPVADFLEERSPIAVGTDSLGSNISLDLLEEVALLRQLAVAGGYRNPNLDRQLIEAATIGGATALGLANQVGSIEVGKRADFAVFDIDPEPRDLSRRLVEQGAGTCLATIVSGTVRWQR